MSAGINAFTPAHDALCWLFMASVRTTATEGQKAIIGQNTAFKQCSLLYGIRNCGGTMGFPICGGWFMELLWCEIWNYKGFTGNVVVSAGYILFKIGVDMRCIKEQGQLMKKLINLLF